MKKLLLMLFPVLFLAVSCNPFAKPTLGGIMKTVNGGADWQTANSVKGNANASMAALSFTRISFDPSNRQTLYIGTINGGLFRSTDSGENWERILSKIYIYDFAINPANPRSLYAAGYYGGQGKVVKTTDNGATWQEVFNESAQAVVIRAIALNPQNPNQVVIGTSSGELILSDDGGLSWRLVKGFNDQIGEILWQNGFVYVLGKTTGLFKSNTDMSDFSQLTTSLVLNQNNYTTFGQGQVSAFNQVYVDPITSALLYLTTNKGLYKSTDEGKTWALLNLPANTSSATRAIAVARSNSDIIYTSVGSTIYKSTDGGRNWQTQQLPTTNLVDYMVVDPVMPQISYASIFILSQ